MISKNIDEITEADLLTLIENQVLEGKNLDYKQKIEIGQDAERKEFLYDVSSFANASGGMIIYGISEQKGFPKSLEGIDDKPDETILKMEGIIRDGINPRIIGIKTRAITLSNTKNAIIIFIPKSYNAPHQVSFKDADKFYSRASNGKYKLDVNEIRIAFNLSETYIDRIKKFKQERLGRIIENNVPIRLKETGKIVLHFLPLISFSPNYKFDLNKILNTGILKPFGSPSLGHDTKYVFDGYVSQRVGNDGIEWNYSLLFKNGILEMVNTSNLVPNNNSLEIPYDLYEETIINGFKNALEIYRIAEVELPVIIYLSFINVKGYNLVKQNALRITQPERLREDYLLLPELLIEEYNIDVEKTLKDWFDSVWNAFGYSRSLNYDQEGNWNPRNR